ncbi:hypothetical protein RchiOBHm_Chr5g0082461 [Rosa chinensis]|uniref:Uncharacterized protein n=1 Tax=Rosa chinensis TaxID=74649 RepID=A0A2P6QND5_ROSCH|nr:hypothetical protein RchiOBHm_Chr5g0082461 [Rosa chinensis]
MNYSIGDSISLLYARPYLSASRDYANLWWTNVVSLMVLQVERIKWSWNWKKDKVCICFLSVARILCLLLSSSLHTSGPRKQSYVHMNFLLVVK